MRREQRDSRVWGWVLGHVMRRPLVALIGGVAVLLALWPSRPLGMHTKQTGIDDISRDAFPVHEDVRPHARVLPGREPKAPTVVVKATDVTRPACRPPSPSSQSARPSPPSTVVRPLPDVESAATAPSPPCRLPLVGDGADAESQAALATVREHVVPVDGRLRSPAPTVDVGGQAAETKDGNDNLVDARAAGVRLRAQRWRSCCCWSRSGRS